MTEGATELLGDVWKYDPDYNRMAELLGFDRYDREDYGVAQKIAYIRDYLDLKQGKLNELEAREAIHELKKNLGIQDVGKPLLDELYQFSRLEMDRRKEELLTPKPKVVEPVVKEKKEKDQDFSIKKIVKETIQGAMEGLAKTMEKTHSTITQPPNPVAQEVHVEQQLI